MKEAAPNFFARPRIAMPQLKLPSFIRASITLPKLSRSRLRMIPGARLVLLLCLTTAAWRHLEADTVTPVAINGPDDRRINIVVISEGYTQADLANFSADAQRAIDKLFSEEPFITYENYFNIYFLEVASNESGADEPAKGVYVDTAFDAKFDSFGIPRLLSVKTSKVLAALANHFPMYDIGLVVVNSTRYGGSGGTFPVTSNHLLAPEIALHEIGHSFAGLADEYETAGGSPSEAPNATAETNPALLKWNEWVEPSTLIPTPETFPYDGIVGMFEGAVYQSSGWFRPHYNSKMRSLDQPWEQVNSETLIREIYTLLMPFYGHSPGSLSLNVDLPQPLSFEALELMSPQGNNLAITWRVDGSVQPETTATLSMMSSALGNGAHTVSVEVADLTPMVRDQSGELLKRTVVWDVVVSNHLTFADWIAGQFPGEPGKQLPGLDIDRDGFSNFGEFELGTEPEVPDRFGDVIVQGHDDGRLYLEFTRDLNRVGAAIIVEGSDDLDSWSEIARSEDSQPFTGMAEVVESPAGAGKTIVRVNDTMTPESSATGGRFLRLRFLMLPGP